MPADCHEFLRYFTIAEQLSSALIWFSALSRKYFFWVVTQTQERIHRGGAEYAEEGVFNQDTLRTPRTLCFYGEMSFA
jgi:hypothetical protein